MVFIGAHISRESTLIGTLNKIKEANGNALQIFASNPRTNKPSDLNKKFFGNDLDSIKDYIKKNKFSLVIHNPYTINLSMPPLNGKKEMDLKDCYWTKILIQELIIADKLNGVGCVVHCGKHTKNTKEEGLMYMRNCITYIIYMIKELGLKSKLILETSTGQGTELLYKYEDFLSFYNCFGEDLKNYFKICIDTCHVWAAGYELSDIYEMTKKSGNLSHVEVIHINNSKNPKNSHLDRHDEMLNKNGHIPIEDILNFTKKMKQANPAITLILETPSDEYKEEIELISSLK